MSAEMITNHLKNREHRMNKRNSFKRKEKEEITVDEDAELAEVRKKQVRDKFLMGKNIDQAGLSLLHNDKI